MSDCIEGSRSEAPSPPMMATANAFSPMSVPIVGETLSSGASSRPATPASTEETA